MDLSIDELSEEGVVAYSHNGVIVQHLNQNRDDDSYCSGTLYIKTYKCGIFIEWMQTEEKALSVEAQDQGWSMVNEVQTRPEHAADEASCVSSVKIRPIKIDIVDLRSYKITGDSHKLIFTLNDGSHPSPFLFQNDNADKFITALRQFIYFSRSSKDRNLYCATNSVNERKEKDFADLTFPLEDYRGAKWKLFGTYEGAMTVFSKLTNRITNLVDTGVSESENLQKYIESEIGRMLITPADEGYEVIIPEPVTVLPPRPEVKRGPPLSAEEWSRHLDKEGRIVNLMELKQKIFRGGIEPNLRNEVWKLLLGYRPADATSDEWQSIRKQKFEEYSKMKSQWMSVTPGQESRFSHFHKRKSLIEKDVNRTDRTIPYFKGNDNPNIKLMHDILMTYVMYNFDLGYVQGMSDLLSPILYLLEKEEDAFWCFVGFMNKVSNNFEKDQMGMKRQLIYLKNLIKAIDPDLAEYLERHESDNLFFCFHWLLIIFKREFTYQDIMTLWEVLWTDLPGPNFHLFFSLAILDSERNTLMDSEYGFTEILKHINDLSLQIHLEDTLTKAEAIYLQLSAASDLPDSIRVILGMPLLHRESGDGSDEEDFSPARDFVASEQDQVGNTSAATEEDRIQQMYEDSLSFQF